MAPDPAAIAHFSPWSWDVDADVVWSLPGLFVMHGQRWPAHAVDQTTAIPVPREHWLEALPVSQRERVRNFCEAILETGIGGEMTYPVTVGDTIRWMLLQAAVGESEGGSVRRVLGYVRNVTADKLLELRHDRTQRDLEQQQQVLERIAAGDALEGTLELLCRHIERVYPGVFAAIMLHDHEAGVLRTGAAPSLSRDYSAAVDGLAVTDGNGACGTAAATGQVVVIDDARSDARAAAGLELFESFGLRSMWSYPMHSVTGAVLGTIALYRTETFTPSEAEIGVIGRVGHLAALAIERDGIHTALQMSANVYPATGLLNRSSFQELLNARLDERLRHTALLFVEVDRLKYLGDDLGQSASAALLAEVARRLRAAAGTGGLIGRFSSDEFTVAVDCSSPAQLEELVTRVQVAFSTPVSTRDLELFLVATVGAATTDPTGDAYSLIRDAAAAMQTARADGLGGHRIYSQAMRPASVDLIGRESELRRAIDFGELVLHYQPILDIANHRWDRLEALVRWNHPTRGLLAPAEFLPLAEKSGLIVPLGQRVIELAAQDSASWVAAMPSLRIALNISVLQLDDPRFVEDTIEQLERGGLPLQSINFEIAESSLIQKLDTVAPVLERLQAHSVRAVVDDFGAGYSSLAHLGQLPISSLKIDGHFIGQITTDTAARTVVRSIIEIARAHKLTVVAEGVENAETLAAVEELGCDYAQGFHVALPAPADKVSALLFEASAPQPLQLLAPRPE
ncbi:MAG TPA: GGDEF domain-containing protein [Solirubrobacteraceae bacterium]|nr:GGDEF domain-containing protein [Solirubrobacteraceae bacterium]